jgi:hypothetical protein
MTAPTCCQGAMEVDGLRVDGLLVDMAIDTHGEWVMYFEHEQHDGEISWVPCDACPMCGERYGEKVAQVAEVMRGRTYLVLPSHGCEFKAPERIEHQGDTEYLGMVAAHRRAWERHPCPFTGRVVRIERVVGVDAETVDTKTGAIVFLPLRRLAQVDA